MHHRMRAECTGEEEGVGGERGQDKILAANQTGVYAWP